MVKGTQERVQRIIDTLYREKHIDDMTKKWLSQTPNPLRVPLFYTLTKIHKPTPVGRLIISGCDRTDFIICRLYPSTHSQSTKVVSKRYNRLHQLYRTNENPTTLVFMDVTSLYTNIPQDEGITTVCKAYEAFYNRNIPIPTNSLKEMLQLTLGENSFSFNGRNYLQTHGTAMGTKMAVAFANIFMSEVETEILKASDTKPLQWKRYIDDGFSLWGCERDKIQLFINEANKHHPTIKFTAEISEKDINFLDTTIFKGERSYLGHPDTFQINRDLSVHIFYFLSRPRRQERFHKGRGTQTPQNQLLRTHFQGQYRKLQIAPVQTRLPSQPG